MEGLRSQPDLHDLLQIEDDALPSTEGAVSPERSKIPPESNTSKINTPAKVLMVGEPVLVKTDQSETVDTSTAAVELSGNSSEDLADGINTPSPETAAAMESLIADDDLTSASPKLDADIKQPISVPVHFTAANSSKFIVRPQTSIMSSLKSHQPVSIAGKKFMVATQPVQVVRKEGNGGPIVTKFVVKKSATANAASQKSPIVFTKGKGVFASDAKSSNFKSGSIVLSPIKGGFKIPIKSPIKVSVIPPANTRKLPTFGKPITVPIQTSVSQLQQKIQSNSNALTAINSIIQQARLNTQQPTALTDRRTNINSHTERAQGQVFQQSSVVPSGASMLDSQGMKIQYVQLIPPSNNMQQPTLRSNQGQPITFTSMAQLNGGNLSLNQSGGTITYLPPHLQKLQYSSSNTHRKAQTVTVAIPSQSAHQIKPQRLIMPAATLPNRTALAPSPVLAGGNIGYAMVPAKYVEQLTKQLNAQNSFTQGTPIQPAPASPMPAGKIGVNGKLKKPCNCTKSQCLKLYCECFANGQFCDDCNCINCFNNLNHEVERSKAVKQCLERNPSAFRPKIGRGKDDSRTHQKGCNCKRSGCLKNYCECYEARIPCTSKCKCIGCKNYEETMDRRSLMSLADAAEVRVQQQTAAKTKLSNQIGEIRPTAKTTSTGERLPYTFFTQEVIEASCTCLLAQAEEAEKTNRPIVVAEAMILEEFGRCVMQIIQSAGKAKVPHFQPEIPHFQLGGKFGTET